MGEGPAFILVNKQFCCVLVDRQPYSAAATNVCVVWAAQPHSGGQLEHSSGTLTCVTATSAETSSAGAINAQNTSNAVRCYFAALAAIV